MRFARKFGLVFSMATLSLAVTVPLIGPSITGPIAFWALLGAAAGSSPGTHGVLWG